MIGIALNLLGVIFFWLAVEYCLKDQTAENPGEASLMPFADDPEVARRVESTKGMAVKSTSPDLKNTGWGSPRT
ncbi:cbb3-type cytochrome c oxidase subunit 3 [Pseudomonas sp. C2B4]|uniref:cbb3-type cytochrome c oxidase subunit 3 n=1 Tax=Pseudomonas sp. C2B4 TaxID=2735270 RepID=UPI00158615C3|nr:cbb3-type cytochrome c oxidase subunit 3 [Pseudomonas sp. C2B4]NUU35521.1 cbb3-type cytochrome c oxidase subunit 3 [Pseudomonas sp. C2B4]